MNKPFLLFVIVVLAAGCSGKRTLYAVGDMGVVYNVERATNEKRTNWVRVTNFIGGGTNRPPEVIGRVKAKEMRLYRITPE